MFIFQQNILHILYQEKSGQLVYKEKKQGADSHQQLETEKKKRDRISIF